MQAQRAGGSAAQRHQPWVSVHSRRARKGDTRSIVKWGGRRFRPCRALANEFFRKPRADAAGLRFFRPVGPVIYRMSARQTELQLVLKVPTMKE